MNRKLPGMLFLLCSLFHVASVQAEEPVPAEVVVYINPLEYKHPIKLWHFYYDYWYTQGPVVEDIALDVLGKEFGQVSMCEGNNIGKLLVRITPGMFYNPHMSMFYGKITADVFTGSGKPLNTYVAEAKKFGYLNVVPADQIGVAYKMAMQNVVNKMREDPALQNAITTGVPETETSTPCSMMMVLPMRRVNPSNLLNTFER